jgi:antitoxin (DNA-binding transcriptional repressor) of toxin-antitoxin stability system
MSGLDNPVDIEVGKLQVSELLERLREEGRPMQLTDRGNAVALLIPLSRRRRGPLPPPDPRMAAKFNVDPLQLTTEEDWKSTFGEQ